MRARAPGCLLAIGLLVAGCSGGPSPAATGGPADRSRPAAPHNPGPSPQELPREARVQGSRAVSSDVAQRPAWLGKRTLPERSDGLGVVRATPRILRVRRFASIDLLAPPRANRFAASVTAVPARVARRSTWRRACPVGLDDLAYVTMSYWGFDGRPHRGEMIVNEDVSSHVVGVFKRLYRARFPIEEMRVVDRDELDAPPTGDGNNTSSFVCRRTTLGSSWSEHSYGLAVDINPFHNPFHSDDVVVPERASSYVNRSWRRPGMIFEGGVVTRAFTAIGWGWGGRWSSTKDWMHFSLSGR